MFRDHEQQIVDEMQSDAVRRSMKVIAAMMRGYYDELVKQGFLPAEALSLTSQAQATIFSMTILRGQAKQG